MKLNHIISELFSLCCMLCLAGFSLLGSMLHAKGDVDDLFYEASKFERGGIEAARKLAIGFAKGTGADLGYHSADGVEERAFSGTYTMPELPAGQQGAYAYGLAIFSDDGCEVSINGQKVHSRYRAPQALPRLNESFHVLPVLLAPGQEIDLEVNYSNIRFVINDVRPDIDGLTLFIYKIAAGIAVDADRNGTIDVNYDHTTAAAPYRFWVNNDGDIKEDDEKPGPPKQPDHQDEKILTTRDLEDFSRMQFIVSNYQDKLKSGAMEATLKFRDGSTTGNPALKVWPHMDADGSRKYLTDEGVAGNQIEAKLFGTVLKGQGLVFSSRFWDGSHDAGYPEITSGNPLRHLLFEGVSEGTGELVIEFKEGGKSIGEVGSCWVSLMNVRRMYQRVKITPDDPNAFKDPSDIPGVEGDPTAQPSETDMGWVWDQNGAKFTSDPNEEKRYIVFVHGWRMTYERSNKYGESMFKRLWQTGYKGRYVSVRWPTFSQRTNPRTKAILTYNQSDYRAWQSGKPLAKFINSLPSGYDRSLTAHSMGNVVASSALREGASVEYYAILNGAIPAMCYDGNKDLYVFNRFNTPDGDDDPITRQLGFSKKVTDVDGAHLINFCLEDDAALKLWESNNRRRKPDWHNSPRSTYLFDSKREPGERLRVIFHFKPTRHLRSFHEAAAYGTKSRTKAVGAELRTHGSIGTTVDLGQRHGFGKNHSAEWQLRFQKNNLFYQDLMDAFELEKNL